MLAFEHFQAEVSNLQIALAFSILTLIYPSPSEKLKYVCLELRPLQNINSVATNFENSNILGIPILAHNSGRM